MKIVEKSANQKLFFYYHEDFDDATKIPEIVSHIPDYNKYLASVKDLQIQEFTSEDRLLNYSPLLAWNQQLHLFIKYNFVKFIHKPIVDSNRLKLMKKKSKLKDEVALAIKLLRNFHECESKRFKNDVDFINSIILLIKSIIVTSNMRLVKSHMKFYSDKPFYEDLFSDCCYTIIKSVEGFNWMLGFRFSTYAIRCLNCNSRRFVAKISKNRIWDSLNCESVEMKLEPSFLDLDSKDVVNRMLSVLDSREKIVIMERFFEGNTLKVISDKLGITRERVRQIEVDTIKKMRKVLNRDNFLVGA